MSDISKKTLEIIEKEEIRPTPRYYFFAKNFLIWALFFSSIVLGAISVSVILFLLSDYDWYAYRNLETSFLLHVLISIPYLWISFFSLLIIASYYDLKHTRKGYKYTIFSIAISSIFFSFFTGTVLFFGGLGSEIHDALFKNVPMYGSLTYTKEDIWSCSGKGLLGGEIVSYKDKNNFILKDFNGRIWRISGGNVAWQDNMTPQSGIIVKIIGHEATGDVFIVDLIKPWKEK